MHHAAQNQTIDLISRIQGKFLSLMRLLVKVEKMVILGSERRTSIAWVFLAAIILFFITAASSYAASYYVSPSGSDTSGNGSIGSPYKTLTKAYSVGSGGDTFILRDGTYNYSGAVLGGVPKGTSWAAKTTVKAENDGGAIITVSGGADIPYSSTPYYLQVEGLKFNYADQKNILGKHIKFLRCAFQGGPSSGNAVTVAVGSNDYTPGADHILFEDCWVFGGGGRYKVLVYNSTNIVLRRVVTRHDGGWTTPDVNPSADITVYDSQNVAVLNSISIDGTIGVPNYTASFYSVVNNTTATPNENREYRGNIAVNSAGYLMGTEGQGNVTNQVVYDTAAYGGSYGVSQLKGTVLYQRVTVVANGGDGFGIWGGSATVKDSVVVASAGNFYTGVIPQTSALYSSIANAKTAGLWYLPRIEVGSSLAAGGSNGGQRGAQIMNRIGTSGTLFGETGYNTETGESLWPWPYEARIKKEMCADAGITRGFCSDTSLTNYIWNYLGNGNPYDVIDTTPPAAPSGLIVI